MVPSAAKKEEVVSITTIERGLIFTRREGAGKIFVRSNDEVF